MHRLSIAREDQVRALSDQTHALWGGGLDAGSYLDLWLELCGTPWVQKYVTYWVLEDANGNVRSSLKLYRPLLRWAGGLSRTLLLGGIFTPAALRRRGYARELIERVVEDADHDGVRAALLFSDIGTRYYRNLEFHELDADEHWMRIPPGLPHVSGEISLRPLENEDLDRLVEAHRGYTNRRPFSIVRDTEHWEFVLARARGFFRRIKAEGSEQRLEVAERNGRFAGYLFGIEGGEEWNLREVGAVEGCIETMAEIVRCGLAGATSRGARRFYGWLQPELHEALQDLPLRVETRRRMVPMIRTLQAAGETRLPGHAESYIAFQDQF